MLGLVQFIHSAKQSIRHYLEISDASSPPDSGHSVVYDSLFLHYGNFCGLADTYVFSHDSLKFAAI